MMEPIRGREGDRRKEVCREAHRGRARAASVLIQKFLCDFALNGQGAAAEASDGGEDVVGGFGPAERLRVCVADGDVVHDGSLQGLGGPVDTAADLLLGQQAEEPFDLVDPGRRGWREMDVPARSLGKPVADQLGLVGRGVVDD